MSKPIPLTPQEVIDKSGNSFHIKVADYLSSKWWNIEISPYYTDFVTNAPREVDIIAYKTCQFHYLKSGSAIYKQGGVCVKLFIECKYIKLNDIIITWLQETDQRRIERYLSQEKVMKPIAWSYSDDYQITNEAKQTHHYFDHQLIAKLFGNNNQHDPMFQWINQILHSLIHFEQYSISETYDYYIYNYPIIIVNNFNNFYKTDQKRKPEKVTENILFSTSYSYKDGESIKNRDFFVDIVDFENWIDSFLNKIDKELQRYAGSLAIHHPKSL